VQDHPCSQWSIILLAPLDFFDASYLELPLRKHTFLAWIGEESMEGATICLLSAAYRRLYYHWRLLRTHFDTLLNEGNEEIALFRPSLHDELLQDDERFSRSRRYAWAIKCLTNFESRISNNILQWKNFKSARIDHLHEAGTLSKPSRKSIDDIDQVCILLEGLHRYFSTKLASTKALRDGVRILILCVILC